MRQPVRGGACAGRRYREVRCLAREKWRQPSHFLCMTSLGLTGRMPYRIRSSLSDAPLALLGFPALWMLCVALAQIHVLAIQQSWSKMMWAVALVVPTSYVFGGLAVTTLLRGRVRRSLPQQSVPSVNVTALRWILFSMAVVGNLEEAHQFAAARTIPLLSSQIDANRFALPGGPTIILTGPSHRCRGRRACSSTEAPWPAPPSRKLPSQHSLSLGSHSLVAAARSLRHLESCSFLDGCATVGLPPVSSSPAPSSGSRFPLESSTCGRLSTRATHWGSNSRKRSTRLSLGHCGRSSRSTWRSP